MDFIWNIFSASNAPTTLTIIAIFAGPIAAVMITRKSDKNREKERRRWEVFCNLMRSRREQLSENFVGSINLIEVEFHDCREVIDAKVKYFEHLCSDVPSDETAKSNFFTEGERKYAILMQQIAKKLGVNVDGFDIARGGYSPKGWEHRENEMAFMRKLIFEVLHGNRLLPVKIINYTPSGNEQMFTSVLGDTSSNDSAYSHLTPEVRLDAAQRLLRGEELELISRETGVARELLEKWRDQITQILMSS